MTSDLVASADGAPPRLIVPAQARRVLLPDRRRGDDVRWHVLHIRSRQERVLATLLSGMGIDCFLPLRRETHVHRGRRVQVQQPVFPGYVFLWGDRDAAYAADRTRRVAHVIPVNDQDRIEWELSNLHCALVTQAPLEPFPALQVGVRARVRTGPFQGLEGVIASRVRPERLVLQVWMLGTATSLDIGGEHLEVLDA